jgi:hypothetical protein
VLTIEALHNALTVAGYQIGPDLEAQLLDLCPTHAAVCSELAAVKATLAQIPTDQHQPAPTQATPVEARIDKMEQQLGQILTLLAPCEDTPGEHPTPAGGARTWAARLGGGGAPPPPPTSTLSQTMVVGNALVDTLNTHKSANATLLKVFGTAVTEAVAQVADPATTGFADASARITTLLRDRWTASFPGQRPPPFSVASLIRSQDGNVFATLKFPNISDRRSLYVSRSKLGRAKPGTTWGLDLQAGDVLSSLQAAYRRACKTLVNGKPEQFNQDTDYWVYDGHRCFVGKKDPAARQGRQLVEIRPPLSSLGPLIEKVLPLPA